MLHTLRYVLTLFIAGLAAVIILAYNYNSAVEKQSKECSENKGVLVKSTHSFVCIKAEEINLKD